MRNATAVCAIGLAVIAAGLNIANLKQARADQKTQDSHATVEHDEAPWDGPAFSVWIPAETFRGKPDSWIYLRIWNAPEESQKKFVFPDETMKLGRVVYFLDLKSPRTVDWTSQPRQELKGWVRFIKANSRQPVVGEFDFLSEEATSLKGRFEAEWINGGWLEKVEQSDAADSG